VKYALFLILLFASLMAEPPLAPFIPSIHRHGIDLGHYHIQKNKPEQAPRLALFQKLYEQNLYPQKTARSIPKVIHQIWIGSPVPKKYEQLMKTWESWHGWKYKLWTDKEVKNLALINRKLFDKLTNMGAKADVLRCEILYQEGGLYVDIDFECLNPAFFDFASDQYDLFAGLVPLPGAREIELCNGLIGVKKGHPLIKELIETMGELDCDIGTHEIVAMTGPGLFTRKFYDYHQKEVDTVDIAFTPPYFYPLTKRDFKLKEKERKKFMAKETAALHHWYGSWNLKASVDRKALH